MQQHSDIGRRTCTLTQCTGWTVPSNAHSQRSHAGSRSCTSSHPLTTIAPFGLIWKNFVKMAKAYPRHRPRFARSVIQPELYDITCVHNDGSAPPRSSSTFSINTIQPCFPLVALCVAIGIFGLAFCFFNAYPNHISQPLAVSCNFGFTPLHKYHVCISQHPLARPGRSEFGRSVGQEKSAEVRAE